MQDQVLPVRPQGFSGVRGTFPGTVCTTQHVYHITIEKMYQHSSHFVYNWPN